MNRPPGIPALQGLVDVNTSHVHTSPAPTFGQPGFQTRDSGGRFEFTSGMLREPDTDRPRFDLLVPETVPYEDQLLTRVAALMARGAAKYSTRGQCTCGTQPHLTDCPATVVITKGDRNWENADGEAELDRMKAGAFRHFMQWMTGVDDGEDHAAAVVFNLLAAETTASVIAQKNCPLSHTHTRKAGAHHEHHAHP